MKLHAEMRCEKCGKVYGKVEAIGVGQALVWKTIMLPVQRIDLGVGDLVCSCGHRTRLDLKDFGMR